MFGHALVVAYVPAAVKGREHQLAVIREHLFAAHGQTDITIARLQKINRQLEPGAGAGAGVFDIDHGNALNAHLAQGNLAPDHVLAFHMALRCVREERALDRLGSQPRIFQRRVHAFTGHFLDRLVAKLTKRRHPDADNIDISHV